MTKQIKEALAADLANVHKWLDDKVARQHVDKPIESFERIASALEAAQQEAEAWEAIDAWLLFAGRDYDLAVGVDDDGGWYARILFDQHEDSERLGFKYEPYETRLEALIEAAKWCRAELAK